MLHSNDKIKANALLLASLADYCIYNHDLDNDINNNEFLYKRKKHNKNNKDNDNNNNRRKQKHIWNEFDPDYEPNNEKDVKNDNFNKDLHKELNNNKNLNINLNRHKDTDSVADFKTHKPARCGLEEFKEAILYRDPYSTGFTDRWG
jgi:hypothetical protein